MSAMSDLQIACADALGIEDAGLPRVGRLAMSIVYGHLKVIDGDLYVDSDGLQDLSAATGGTLRHLGFGDFGSKTPDGRDLICMRMDGVVPLWSPGTGRPHRVHGGCSNANGLIERIKKAVQGEVSCLGRDALTNTDCRCERCE